MALATLWGINYFYIQFVCVSLLRDGNNGPVKQYNGPSITSSSDPVPNFYETAVEHYSNPDFFSTYNVDRSKFAQMTRSKNIFVSTDNLSSSLDDLLESCRQGSEKQLNSVIKVEANGRLSNSFSEIANGQTSHNPEVEGLRYDLQAVQVVKNRTYQGS